MHPKKPQKQNLRASLGLTDIYDLKRSTTFSTNALLKDKTLYQSSTSKQIIRNRFLPLSDKRIVKQILRKFSSQQLNFRQKEEFIGRLIAFSAEIDDMEGENKKLNLEVGICREEIENIRNQMKFYSNTIKQKDNYMLTLKGKLYEKDQSLRTLNSKLNMIIQAIEQAPMEQRSSYNHVSRLIHQNQDVQIQNSFSIQQSSELCLKIAQLEAQNNKYTQRVFSLQKLLTEKNNNNKIEQMHQIIQDLVTERNQLQNKLIKSKQQLSKLSHSSSNNDKQRAKPEIVGVDELEQLRQSIKSLQEWKSTKMVQIQKLQVKNHYMESQLQQAKSTIMQKIQQINSLKMQLKLSQDILQIEISTGKQKIQTKSNIHKQKINKLSIQNESLKQQVQTLKRNLKAIANSKQQTYIECTSSVSYDVPPPVQQKYVESICYDMDIGNILLKNNFLQDKIQDMRLAQVNYLNQIQQLKQAVSYLEQTSVAKEHQKFNFNAEIEDLKKQVFAQINLDIQSYIKKIDQYQNVVIPQLHKELQSEREQKDRISKLLQSNTQVEQQCEEIIYEYNPS